MPFVSKSKFLVAHSREVSVSGLPAASDDAKFSAALPKPARAAVHSPGCCQVCL